MKVVIFLGLILLLANGVPVVSAQPVEEAQVQAVGEKEDKFCPVCGPEEGMTGDVSYEHEGKMFWFCSPECLEEFKKNPEKYMKANDHKDSGDHADHDHEGHDHK